jgi:hypothetical protein
MKFFQNATDGGKDSGVTGFFLIEIKPLLSVVFLRFRPGTREAFHSHAFDALTWFLKGRVREHRISYPYAQIISVKEFGPSFRPKFTPRDNHHKVESLGVAWALSIRGPWGQTWREYLPKLRKFVTLTHGRKVAQEVEAE